MKAGSMEALIGASQNMKLVSTPMRVYKEAERKGDTATMERAMGYVTEYEQKAKDCSDKALEETAKELKEEQKEQEAKLEKVRKERKESQEKTEQTRKKYKAQEPQKGKEAETQKPSQEHVRADFDHIIDRVDISEEGKAALEKGSVDKNLSGN